LELKHQGFKIDLAYASSSEVYGEVDDIDDIRIGQTRLLGIDRKPISILQKSDENKIKDELYLEFEPEFSYYKTLGIYDISFLFLINPLKYIKSLVLINSS
jgi:hypothetical protein